MADIYWKTVSTVKDIQGTLVYFTTADADGAIRLFTVDTAKADEFSAKYSTPTPLAKGGATLALHDDYMTKHGISTVGKVKEPAALPSGLPTYRCVPLEVAKLTVIASCPDAPQPKELTIELFDPLQARQGQWIYVAPDGRMSLLLSEDTRADLGLVGMYAANTPQGKLDELAATVGDGAVKAPSSDDELFLNAAVAMKLTRSS